jgi:hypothetical protein
MGTRLDYGAERGIHSTLYANDLLGFNYLPEYWYQQSECTIASLAAANDKVSRLLRHNLAVFPHIERRAVHARSLPSILCRTTQGIAYSSGKAQWSPSLRSRFRLHELFSNSRGARPELSYTAQLSAKGR